MAKTKRTTTDAPAPASTDAPAILSLAHIRDLEQPAQVALYVETENRVRCGFLQQGKILSCLGEGGTEALREAGIRPTTLANARNAQWVLETFRRLEPAVLIHNGTEPVPFTEEVYDTFTLRQCDLLRKAFSAMGVVTHRPSIAKARELTQLENWDDNIECFFDNGTDLAGMEARRAAQAAEAEAERQRVADMEATIARQQEELRQAQEAAAATAAAAPPPPPSIAFNGPETPAEEEAPPAQEEDAEDTGAHVDPEAEAQAEGEEEEEGEDAQEAEEPEAAHVDPPVQAIAEDVQEGDTDPAPAGEESPTAEEVAAALTDATAGIPTLADWEEAMDAFWKQTAMFMDHADESERAHVAESLGNLLEFVTGSGKPAAAPEAPAKASRRGRKAAVAA
jgi:hypothetical protein